MPTLPDKNFTTKIVASSAEFVTDRCGKLDAFLRKVTAHSVLRTSAALATFLEASEEAWAAWTVRPQEGLILAKQNGSGTAALKHAANSLLTVPRAEEMDVEYERLRTYFTELEVHLSECTYHSEKLVRRQVKLAAALKEFGSAMGDLAAGQSGAAAHTLAQLSTCCTTLGESSGLKAATLSNSLSEPVKEMQRSISGVQNALTARSEAHAVRLALAAELDMKRERLLRLRGAGGSGDITRMAGEEREVQVVQQRAEQAKREYEMVCVRMGGELKKADAQRAANLSLIARALGEAEREMAADQAKAYSLMGLGGSAAAPPAGAAAAAAASAAAPVAASTGA